MPIKKIAIINARLQDPKDGSVAIQNILLINGKVMGLGYIPDDEESNEVIDLKGCTIETEEPISLLRSPSFKVVDSKTAALRLEVINGEITQSHLQ